MKETWRELGIAATTDVREIRKAYAQRLKHVHPEDDPEGFQLLRTAYEVALDHAARKVPRVAVVLKPQDPAPETVRPDEVQQPDPSEERIDRARNLVEKLLEIQTAHGLDAAASRLKDLFDSTELQDLELKHFFEGFLYDDERLNDVAERFQGEEAYQVLVKLREQRRVTASLPEARREEKARYLALEMLMSPYRLWAFYRHLWRYPELAKLIPAQIQVLRQDAPAAVKLHLDAATVEWWTKRRPRPITPLAAIIAKRKLATIFFTFWAALAISRIPFPFYFSAFKPFVIATWILAVTFAMVEGTRPHLLDRFKAFEKEMAVPVGLLLALGVLGAEQLPKLTLRVNMAPLVQAQERAEVPSGFLFEKIFWLSEANWYGLKPGDIVVKYGPDRVVDGKSFEDARNLRLAVGTPRVKLIVMRSGQPVELEVPVGKLGFEGRDWTLMRDKIIGLVRHGNLDEAAQLLAQAEKERSIPGKEMTAAKKLLKQASGQ